MSDWCRRKRDVHEVMREKEGEESEASVSLKIIPAGK